MTHKRKSPIKVAEMGSQQKGFKLTHIHICRKNEWKIGTLVTVGKDQQLGAKAEGSVGLFNIH